MRTVCLLMMTMLVIEISSAQGQGACSNAYISCMDKCVSRPSKTLQDSCIDACQSQNNACFSKQFGGPGPDVQTVKQEPAQAGDAQAGGAQAAGEPRQAADGPRPAAKAAKPTKTAKPTTTAKPAMKPAERRPQ